MPEKRIPKRKLSKTARSLKCAKGALAAASQTKTAVAPKMQYDDEVKTEQDNEGTFLSTEQKLSSLMARCRSRSVGNDARSKDAVA